MILFNIAYEYTSEYTNSEIQVWNFLLLREMFQENPQGGSTASVFKLTPHSEGKPKNKAPENQALLRWTLF